MDPERPFAGSILIDGDRIAALDVREAAGAERVEVPVVLPGFVDPHLHLMATAARSWSVDLEGLSLPEALRTISDAPSGSGWMRATGLDDALEPALDELDAASPERPLLVHGSSGHVVLANSSAMRELGVQEHALADAQELLASRVPRRSREQVLDALRAVGADLAAHGITGVCDATLTNARADIDFLLEAGLPQRVTVMPGIAHLDDLRYGGTVAHAKFYVNDDDDPGFVAASTAMAHRHGFPVAFHVLDVQALDIVLDALDGSGPPAGTRDRLEHVALSLPEQVGRIAGSGVEVVTQPSFLKRRGAKYVREISEVERDWLYRVRSLIDAGARVSGSSDSPVVPARPLEIVSAAVERRFGDVVFGPDERVDRITALGLATGWRLLRAGAAADLVLLDDDPLHADDVESIAVRATLRAGEVISGSL
jgi:predicted amidohydrolase YtcJ